ncbi:MAG: Ribosomal large subunit pseudouridine synthase D [Candidatus Omnitrophica bacterium ADurb.Bin277]|nr:MAG: Ribosomal large subunit pseudouridine synthase D [Candidatus Omnitrophica bacterium ADurb.Bin277]
MREFRITCEGQLLETLFRLLADTKRTKVRRYLKFGSVLVNGNIEKRFDHRLIPGDMIRIRSAREAAEEGALKYGIKIAYEDESLLVIEKPSGLLTISTGKVSARTAFFAANEHVLKEESSSGRGKKIFLVHRLDKEVSGLLMFAKTAGIKEALQTNWQDVVKRYYAVVEGIPGKEEATLRGYLRENKFLKVYSTDQAEGSKFSVTHYRVLLSRPDYSLLEVELGTGRKHQIRVQLSDIGHPIAGDKQYGAKTDPAKRIALHSHYLAFIHPATGKEIEVRSGLPDVFNKILKQDTGPSR